MLGLLEDDTIKLDFGRECGAFNYFCEAENFFANTIGELLNLFIGFSFAGSNDLEAAELGFKQLPLWLGFAVLVTIAVSATSIGVAFVIGNKGLIIRALLGSILTYPAMLLAYAVINLVLPAVDEFSAGLLEQVQKRSIKQILAGVVTTKNDKESFADIGSVISNPTGPMLLLAAILMIGFLFIACVFAFRDLGLMVLIAFGPLAFMMLPAKGAGSTWLSRWISGFITLLLTKPLMYGFLIMLGDGFNKLETFWSFAGFTLTVGVMLASFLPLTLFSLFSFVGGQEAADGLGSKAGQNTTVQLKQAGAKIVNRSVGRIFKAGAVAATGGAGAATIAATKPASFVNDAAKNAASDTAGTQTAGSKGNTSQGAAKDSILSGGKGSNIGSGLTPGGGVKTQTPKTPKPYVDGRF